ncbi:MAG: riboflavin synthase subunit alpha [Actinomycetia bacterium]|nr:riboflavin synthase subunit alpha [Actinomycetes bacterium]
MFTGIVQDQCEVVSVDRSDGVAQLTVDLASLAQGLDPGASVANNGVCLTVSSLDGTRVLFDVISETLELTNLGRIEPGDQVNIERSLRFGDELGGHILSGHIAGVAVVQEIVEDGGNRTMWFGVDPGLMRYLLWKGWVGLDGVSLTVSRLDRRHHRLGVSLIPQTLARTTLGRVGPGDTVNLEIDAQTQAIVEGVRTLLSDPDLRRQIFRDAELL